MSKTFSTVEVAKHKAKDDLWIIVEGDVYDLTRYAYSSPPPLHFAHLITNIISLSPHSFQTEHPGGQKILQRVGGKDATQQFWKYHNQGILNKYKSKLMIGSVEGKAPEKAPEPPKAVAPVAAGPAAPVPAKKEAVEKVQSEALEPFGEMIPYGDPAWYQGVSSFIQSEMYTWMLISMTPPAPLPLLQ